MQIEHDGDDFGVGILETEALVECHQCGTEYYGAVDDVCPECGAPADE